MWFFSRDPLKDFAYEIGEKVPGYGSKSIWSLHEGTRKGSGERVSVFSFESKLENENHLLLAKGAFKRVKTLRHPNYIVFLDGLETEKSCYIVTEAIVPLPTYIHDELVACDQVVQKHVISWGLHQIAKALCFLSKDCNLSHNNLNLWSVFVDEAGEWKVGGMEYALPHSPSPSAPIANTIPLKGLPHLDKYDPPERTSGNKAHKWSSDMWALGCLIWEIFNGEFDKKTALKHPLKIPKELVSVYCQLVGSNPISRPSPSAFLTSCTAPGAYMHNDFVKCMHFIEEIQIKDNASKADFFSSLASKCDTFPARACKHKLLPRLREALDFGDASLSILNPLFKLGKLLTTDEFQKSMVAVVVKLFSSPDRATRVKLLQQMETFAEHIPAGVVNQQIFPSIATGFHDTNPVVREQTVKSMLHVAGKLDYRNLNEEVMKHFARLQANDSQGGIRTNTTICLGKIACHLHPQVRQKVLVSAFSRAFKDPFPASRQAAVMAFSATQRFFSIHETAQRILPSLCLLTTDPDKSVRDQVFKTIKSFLGRLEQLSEDPDKLQELEKDVSAGASGVVDVAGWTGWAVSGVTSLTSKLYKSGKRKDAGVEKKVVAGEKKKEEEEEKEREERGGGRDEKEDGVKSGEEGRIEREKEGDGWENEEWADLNTTEGDNVIGKKEKDGWDDDDDDDADWGSLEQIGASNNSNTRHSTLQPPSEMKAASSYDWGEGVANDFFSSSDMVQRCSKETVGLDVSVGEWGQDACSRDNQSKKAPLPKPAPANKSNPPSQLTPTTTKHPLKLTSRAKAQPEPDFFNEGW